jgi:hypothetical protein
MSQENLEIDNGKTENQTYAREMNGWMDRES